MLSFFLRIKTLDKFYGAFFLNAILPLLPIILSVIFITDLRNSRLAEVNKLVMQQQQQDAIQSIISLK